MKRFVTGQARGQATLFPERLDDFIAEDNPVRVIDVFVEELPLRNLGFTRVDPLDTGRPAYHPAVLLKLYIYGYLNPVQSSRRLERESQRNVELMWLTERLTPDHKTIADFRKDNGKAIRQVCREFIVLCRRLELFSDSVVAIDGSKFKAVNNRDRNYTRAKLKRRLEQIDESIARYLGQLDSADREESAIGQCKRVRLEGIESDCAGTGSADLRDRPRCPLHGHQRARFKSRQRQSHRWPRAKLPAIHHCQRHSRRRRPDESCAPCSSPVRAPGISRANA